MLEKEFDFTNKDMRNIRDEIKRELSTSKICHDFGQMPEKRIMKRKSLDNVCHPAPMKQTKIGESLECRQRRFWNHDNEVLPLIILFSICIQPIFFNFYYQCTCKISFFEYNNAFINIILTN